MRYHAGRTAKRGDGSYTVALEELEGWLAAVPVIFIVPPKTRLLRYIRPTGKKLHNIIPAAVAG